MSDPLVGRAILEYEVLERLGRGGMGSVYRVRHRRLGYERAMKLVRPELLEAAAATRRFEREARVLSSIQHPNVVSFFEFGTLPDGAQFLVMEYLVGESLEARLEASKAPLALPEALRIFSEVAAGLEELHRLGILHRDLSPDNILLASTSRGIVTKLIDLGIALPIEAEAITRFTGKGRFIGKLHYASPEQLQPPEGTSLDGRSDIYSLGVVMYEALSRKRPIDASTPPAIIRKKLDEDPVRLAALDGATLPRELVDLVMQMLGRRAAERPQTATAVREVLVRLGGAARGAASKTTTAPDAPPDEPLQVGSRVGQYLLEAVIGEGGMGTVYRASHEFLGVARAFKVVKRQWVEDAQARERFLREARVTVKLEHPNLVRLHECGALPNGGLYLVQELVEGESLKQRLQRERRLAPERAVAIVAAAARGLGAAHALGVVHRDVSPDNMLLVSDGAGGESVKVIDFGIAKAAALDAGRATLTGTGTFVGKLEYCSPEQAGKLEEGEELDGRSDIYSLGVVLYQALTGRLPFESSTAVGFLAKHLTTPPPSPQSLGVSLPPRLEELVLAMLEKDRAKRPQSMAEVADRLARSLAPAPAAAPPAEVRARPAAASPLATPPPGARGPKGPAQTPRQPARPPNASSAPAGAERAGPAAARGREATTEKRDRTAPARPRAASTSRRSPALTLALAALAVTVVAGASFAIWHYFAGSASTQSAKKEAATDVPPAPTATSAAAIPAPEPPVPAPAPSPSPVTAAAEPTPEATVTVEAAATEDSNSPRAQAERLVAEGEALRRAGNWTEPEGANAVDRYRQAFKLDPESKAAYAGLEALQTSLLERGRKQFAAGDLDGARSSYESARAVLDGKSVTARLEELDKETARRERAAAVATAWERARQAATPAALEAFLRDNADAPEATLVAARELLAELQRKRDPWQGAIEAIAGSQRYGWLRISRQDGLVPLGADAQSGLWEFAVEGTGTPPDVRDGRVVRSEEMAVVLVLLPGGSYQMGSAESETPRDSDEGPRHEVKVRAFFLSKYEMTQGQWQRVKGANPSSFKVDGLYPVETVSWDDAMADTALKSVGLRLPSESEWEYGARAGSVSAIFTGGLTVRGLNNAPELDAIAWYGGNSGVTYAGAYDCSGWPEKQYSSSTCGTHRVGEKRANAWGLHDVLGNVWEWCQDSYVDSYKGAPADGSARDASGAPWRVFRGSSWRGDAGYCRSANRVRREPLGRDNDLGLRPARSLR